MLPKNLKKKNGPYTGPVLLRQGALGMSQYVQNQWPSNVTPFMKYTMF